MLFTCTSEQENGLARSFPNSAFLGKSAELGKIFFFPFLSYFATSLLVLWTIEGTTLGADLRYIGDSVPAPAFCATLAPHPTRGAASAASRLCQGHTHLVTTGRSGSGERCGVLRPK